MLPKTEAVINWIRRQFKDIPAGKAIIGISGGKDSTIAAALCVEALGADRVIGVLMPQGVQKDISDSYEVVATLKLQYHVVNIGAACEALYHSISDAVFLCGGKKAVETKILLPEEVIASKLEAKKSKVAEKDVIKNDGIIEMRQADKYGKIEVMTLRNKSSLINYIHHITALGKLSYGTVKIQYKGSIGADGLLKENSKIIQKGEPLSYDDIAKAWNVFHLIPSNGIVLYNYHTSDIVLMLSVIK